MKVTSSELSLAMAHQSVELHQHKVTVRAWRDPAPPREAVPPDTVEISEAGQSSLAAEVEEAITESPKLRLLHLVLEAMFGGKIKVVIVGGDKRLADEGIVDASAAPSVPAAARAWNVDIQEHEIHLESEHLAFSAQGAVRTADGREIRFDLSLRLDRQYVQEANVSVITSGTRQDPLVLSLDAASVQLSDDRVAFDLDSDGNDEIMPFVRAGSGFLVLDRDDNGRVDDGSELFGPATGDGFAELAALDIDGNGWIDEADPGFDLLKVWTEAATPEALRSLEEVDVGALSVSALETPFAFKDAANGSLGSLRASTVYLKETGGAGFLQQVDPTV